MHSNGILKKISLKALIISLDQEKSKFLLQIADSHRNGGLRHVELTGGPRYVPIPAGRTEILYLLKLHYSLDLESFSFLISIIKFSSCARPRSPLSRLLTVMALSAASFSPSTSI